MSTKRQEDTSPAGLSPYVFQAIVITDERVTVLAALTQQAVEHFGHTSLTVKNVRVTREESHFLLASGEFANRGYGLDGSSWFRINEPEVN